MKPLISIIITTYNNPLSLELILCALDEQEEKSRHGSYEAVIADDGSSEDTRWLIENIKNKLSYPIHHVWQPDKGFRVAMIRNKAATIANGEYLIFIDGDCIPTHLFIKNHFKMMEKGWLVSGNRILLTKKFTNQVIQEKISVNNWTMIDWLIAYFKKQCNRFLPAVYLPLGWIRKIAPKKWRGAKTCNLGMWRDDFLSVNGFDENYVGWGYEDSDLVIRLINKGIFNKNGRFAIPVIHLWHKESNRDKEKENYERLNKLLLLN
jgi:glycosyltransferase involved in cell wall biosynthesis